MRQDDDKGQKACTWSYQGISTSRTWPRLRCLSVVHKRPLKGLTLLRSRLACASVLTCVSVYMTCKLQDINLPSSKHRAPNCISSLQEQRIPAVNGAPDAGLIMHPHGTYYSSTKYYLLTYCTQHSTCTYIPTHTKGSI